MLIQLFLFDSDGIISIGKQPIKQIYIPDEAASEFLVDKIKENYREILVLSGVPKERNTILKVFPVHPIDLNITYVKTCPGFNSSFDIYVKSHKFLIPMFCTKEDKILQYET